MSFLAFLFVSTPSDAEDWLYFIENNEGDKFYIDVDSIQQLSPQQLRLKQKIEPWNSPDVLSLGSDLEIDCDGRRIRSLSDTTFFKDGKAITSNEKNQFRTVTVHDLEESLMELVCSLKKTAP